MLWRLSLSFSLSRSPLSLSIYLPTYLSSYLSISTYLPMWLSAYLSSCLSVSLPIYLSTCHLPAYLPTLNFLYLSLYLYLDLHPRFNTDLVCTRNVAASFPVFICVCVCSAILVCLCVCLYLSSIYLPTYLSIYLSIYKYVYIYISTYLPIYLSIYIYLYLSISIYRSMSDCCFLPPAESSTKTSHPGGKTGLPPCVGQWKAIMGCGYSLGFRVSGSEANRVHIQELNESHQNKGSRLFP